MDRPAGSVGRAGSALAEVTAATERVRRLPGRASPRASIPCAPVVVALVLSLIALGVGSSSASAVITHLGDGEALSYQPVPGAVFNPIPLIGADAEYHGGPVMTLNTNYAIYWAPSGSPAYPGEYQSGINRYFQDLAHDSGGYQNVDSVSAQYTDEAGEFANYNSTFGGAFVDTEPYPSNTCSAAPKCLDSFQLETALYNYITANKLPKGLSYEYFLLTPPGVESCFDEEGFECSAGSLYPTYCAYHTFFFSGGEPIVYAIDPYVTEASGCADVADQPSGKSSEVALQGGLTHEHSESITDPEINAWYGPEGYEIGDKCRTFEPASEFGKPLGKAPNGAPYNQLINGDEYWYQQEWSNQGSECKQRLAPPIHAPFYAGPRRLSAGEPIEYLHGDWQFVLRDRGGTIGSGGILQCADSNYSATLENNGLKSDPVAVTSMTIAGPGAGACTSTSPLGGSAPVTASPGAGAAWTGSFTTNGKSKIKGDPTLTFTAMFPNDARCTWTAAKLESTFNTDGQPIALTTSNQSLKLDTSLSDTSCPTSGTISATGTLFATSPDGQQIPVFLATNREG